MERRAQESSISIILQAVQRAEVFHPRKDLSMPGSAKPIRVSAIGAAEQAEQD